MLDLRRQYASIREDVLAAIERVCASQVFVLGPEVEALERELAAFTGAAEAVGCASGTDALWLALVAGGVKPGDGVITTAFSFFASASSIVRAGARPVLLDVEPATLNLDPKAVENFLRQREPLKLGAILPVHLYGQCADMDAFSRISKEFDVPIVEDAAQAIGASWRDRRAGSLGVAAAFSFYPTKNLSAYGDAGLVTTNDPALSEHMRHLRNHGSARRYYHEEFGWNSRLDAIQGAVLRVKMRHIEEWNRSRRERAETYDLLFTQSGLIDASKSPVRVLTTSPHAHHVYHQYVVRVADRNALKARLAERGIGSSVFYPVPLHLQKCFAALGGREGDFPQAERAAQEVLALPMFAELTDAEVDRVVSEVLAGLPEA